MMPGSQLSPPPTMAFVTGCGRSGTTILGKILAQHPDVAYLNDRHELWIEPFPFTDVWGHTEPGGPPARLALDESDARATATEARRRFGDALDRYRAGKRMLVEKLPINNFRLGFLSELRPDARIVNIVRHGSEVARSIADRVAAGKWYGRGGAKWAALADHARERGLGRVVERCNTDLARGLLEWRLSVEAAERFRARRLDVPWLQLRYEDLLADPVSVARSLAGFLVLPRTAAMERFAGVRVRRQSAPADRNEVSPEVRAIAGEALERLGYAPAEAQA